MGSGVGRNPVTKSQPGGAGDAGPRRLRFGCGWAVHALLCAVAAADGFVPQASAHCGSQDDGRGHQDPEVRIVPPDMVRALAVPTEGPPPKKPIPSPWAVGI